MTATAAPGRPISTEPAADVAAALLSPSRLAAVSRSGLLDSAPEDAFDALTRMAAVLLKVPASFVSVVDHSRDFYKSQVGLPDALAAARQIEGPTFCHHSLDRDAALVIEDTHAQPEWRAVPTVDTLGVRAYVGMPLRLDGETIGSFCVVDQQPRQWSTEELRMLEQLAVSAERELALRVALRDARDSAARLQELVREKEEMVAVVAHDLRTPLQVLTLSTALLERSCTPAQKVITERMTSATGAIRRMADDLLSEHAALPKDGARPGPLGSAKFLQDVVHTMSLIGDRANVALVVGHVDDVTLSIDYAQMLRVFCNLIGNAIKYSPAGSEVTLSAHRNGPWLRMAVTDLGSGMGEDEQRHAFDRGWQGVEGLARGDGAGLGLPIVKTLVERHGGEVRIESALGRGTRVLVSLPCR